MVIFQTVFLTAVMAIITAQSPCDPKDDGPIPPVPPTLYLSITEASLEDLTLHPDSSIYQDEIPLYGSLNPASQNAVRFEPMDDFQLLDPRDYFVFEVDSTGQKNIMRLYRPLDRDGATADMADDTDIVTFTLKCAPLANLTAIKLYQVSVLIKDINDNPPTFLEIPTISHISERSPIGMKVLTVRAEDKDLNLDGGLYYGMVEHKENINDGSDVFYIDRLTGEIQIKGTLDFESLGTVTRYYTLVIFVRDTAYKDRYTTQMTLQIPIDNVDELGPAFEYEGCIRSSRYCIWPTYTTFHEQALNTPLKMYPVPNIRGNTVDIMAKDRDFDSRSTLKFTIVSTVPAGYNQYFDLDATRYVYNSRVVEIKQTKDIPKQHWTGFEIFLKVEEVGQEDLPGFAMVIFVDNNGGTATESASNSNFNADKQDGGVNTDEQYSNITLTLIVIVAITLTLVVCLGIAVLCLILRNRQKSSDKQKLVMKGHTNHGAVLTPL